MLHAILEPFCPFFFLGRSFLACEHNERVAYHRERFLKQVKEILLCFKDGVGDEE